MCGCGQTRVRLVEILETINSIGSEITIRTTERYYNQCDRSWIYT